MTRSTPRILCVDSSARRLHDLQGALERAGFEVWTARGASDAVCLVSGIQFDVMAMDQVSSLSRPEVWECLAESQPGLPILVHSGVPKMSALCRHSQVVSSGQSQNPEVVLALLLLLLEDGPTSRPRRQEWAAA
jgi:DNA-binding NtrC family response regulator